MANSISGYTSQVEQATPADRDRYLDLLRAVAISAVVLGHWFAASVFTDADGRMDGLSVLEVAEWTHWVTLGFQVMPVFFLVGGYANATSWERHAGRGGTWPAWVHRRSVRLLRPTAVFVGAGVTAVVAARLLGADPELVDRAGWVSGIALWFLAVYVGVAALTPLSHHLHRRWPLPTVLVLAAAVAAGDVARVATGENHWAAANFVLGWGLIHQAGYWWHDGVLPEGTARTLLPTAGGVAAIVVLAGVGPWPVAMVDVPGAEVQNSSPPSLALLALATVQAGVILALADRAREWLRRPLLWAVVATVNRVVLTLFLWHMAAVVIGAGLLYGTGLLPEPEPLSAEWFAWRPVWIAVLALTSAVLVAAFTPAERGAANPAPARADSRRAAGALAAIGVGAACLGLMLLTLGGLAGDGPLGIPVVAGGLFAAGAAMTSLAGRFAPQPGNG